MSLILGISCVLLVSVVGVYGIRAVAVSRNWVAKPRADRWHSKPTALHGGVGFFFPFLAGSAGLYGYLVSSNPDWFGTPATLKLVSGYFGGMAIMFVTGLFDDLYQFRPSAKLLLEVVATVVFIAAGGVGYMTGNLVFDTVLTFVWFIGIVNAVNLLDNMDGASSGVVLIGTVGVGLVGYFAGMPQIPLSTYFGALLAAAILGFWFFNRPPASIFMGDSGSLFMGFAFAGITLPGPMNLNYGIAERELTIHSMLIAATLAAIPILDTSLVTITRLWRGKSPAVGGRDHSTHRLAQSGLGPNQTILVLYALAAACVLFGLGMQRSPQLALLLFSLLVGGFALTAFYLACVAVETEEKREHAWQQLVRSILYRAPLIKGMVDIPLIMFSFYAGYMVRFDFAIPDEHMRAMYVGMLLAVICCLFANLILGIYRFSWRSASSTDVVHFVGCGLLGMILTLAAVTMLSRFAPGHSRGAFFAFGLIYICGLIAVRFGFRFLDDIVAKLRHFRAEPGKHCVLIYGAGREGRLLQTRMELRKADYRVMAFVDDNPALHGTNVDGVKVYAPFDIEALETLGWNEESAEIWISSDQVPDHSALHLREQLERKPAVRRLRLELSEIAQ